MSKIDPPEYTAVGESLEVAQLTSTKTNYIHFIEKDENQEVIDRAISKLLEKDPSKYVSHDVNSFKLGNATWVVTAVELQGEPETETADNDKLLENVCRKEGILAVGSGPNL